MAAGLRALPFFSAEEDFFPIIEFDIFFIYIYKTDKSLSYYAWDKWKQTEPCKV